jgi:uncharacterized repeat protein (TIGR03803 family)
MKSMQTLRLPALLLFAVFICVPFSHAATAHSSTMNVIYTFYKEASEPKLPMSSLIEGDDGELYGTTRFGGTNEGGTVFKVSKAGQLTVLHYFPQLSHPRGNLVRALDGSFYGTTDGGAYWNGTIYKINSDGVVMLLHSLRYDTNGSNPWGLRQTPDGHFYGVTSQGGKFGGGTIFRYATNGAFKSLWSFEGGAGYPTGQLLLAADGCLYGTTMGVNDNGTIFCFSTNGTATTVITFNHTNGSKPRGELILGEDGEMYGSTAYGGQHGLGTLFKLTTNGMLTTLFHFDGTNGASPNGGLMRSRQGYYYGMTAANGPLFSTYGTIFRFKPNGDLTTLARLDGTNGSRPWGKFIQGRQGSIYAALGDITYTLGANGGTIVRIEEEPTIASVVVKDSEATLTWLSFSNREYRIERQSSFSGTEWTAVEPVVLAQSETTSVAVPTFASPQCYYRIVLLP